jgi:putative glycosyltransferase (TIGR04372 family)|tara:strand:- start:2078 stop:3322 length:1245 start_codon:yes stop_codon:yes gene_type:complete
MISFFLEKLNKNKKFNYYFCTPWIYAIGTCCEQIDIAHRIATKNNKKLILIKLNISQKFLKYKVCNHSLFDDLDLNTNRSMIYSLLKKIFSFLINIEFFFIRLFVIINDKTTKSKLPEHVRFLQLGLKSVFYNNKTFFDLSYQDISAYPSKTNINIIQAVKDKLLLDFNKVYDIENKKIVCIHVRDSQFRNDKGRREHRNSKIENYLSSIKLLIDKGYTVIRLGGSKQNKTNFKDTNYLEINDYQNMKFSVFLIERCDFYIGTSSGPLDTAYMFKKPTLLTNAFTILGFPRNENNRVIYRNIELNSKKISLLDFLNLPFFYHDLLYMDNNGLKYIENTAEEIYMGVKEFLLNYENKDFTKTKKQKQINLILERNMENYFKDRSSSNTLLNHQSSISFVKWNKSQEGSICNFQIT